MTLQAHSYDSSPGILTEPARLLFLYANTGAGHLSSARAVKAELEGRYADAIEIELFDPTASGVVRRLPRMYGPIVRWVPKMWGLIYGANNSRLGVSAVNLLLGRLFGLALRRHLSHSKPNLIVSFHALTTSAAFRSGAECPLAVVVTDLGSIHRAWLNKSVDLTMLPSAASASQALKEGLSPHHLAVTGLPVKNDFRTQPLEAVTHSMLRQRWGLEDRFVVLLTGGGEGAGNLKQQAEAILSRVPNVAVAVVCGRNRRLYRDVQKKATRWSGRLIPLPFVDNMAEWMLCADVVAANAGPGTISEAFSCGAALVLTGALPGQEQGNVRAVLDAKAGMYANTPTQLAELIALLQCEPEVLATLRHASSHAATPDATSLIADLLVGLMQQGPAKVALSSHPSR